MSDLPDLEISKLPSIDAVNKDTDYLVISKESIAYASGYGSFKATPNQLMQAVSTTNLSDLGDVNISSPENEQVLKYNGSSWVNSDDDKGTEVEANPSETATDTLTSIKIDDTVYSIEGGGGGTNVVANPAGTATATLNKLQVEETIYSVEGGGGSADHITLTQAEYDALIQAGTVDPDAFYFIKDTNGDGQSFQPVIYSLEEREVGVWADGRPLYEKTYYNAGAITGVVAIPHGISDLERVVSFRGSVLDSNATPADYTRYALPRVAVDGYNIGLDVVSDTDIRVAVPNIFGTRLYGWYVTIQYIKSSDTPGSGTWTPQGVPAVHYSTDEQVVGTWIDGSTVYEKTFNITTLNSGLNSIPHNISNIGDVINIEGTAIRSNGAVQPLGFISSANNYGWNVTVYDFTSSNFSLEVGGQLSLSKVIITVRYTKAST